MSDIAKPVGALIREWRKRLRISQLDLAHIAEVSVRHVSFLETGRSLPSRSLLLRLAMRLNVPPSEHNALMHAAGYAPMYPQAKALQGTGAEALESARSLIDRHSPYPAYAIDRRWNLLGANAALLNLSEGVDASLLVEPLNVLRLCLHPQGLASRIDNLAQWRSHVLNRVQCQAAATADPFLRDLLLELQAYPAPPALAEERAHAPYASNATPFNVYTPRGLLSFLGSTAIIVGTPTDFASMQVAVVSLFPADASTDAALTRPGVALDVRSTSNPAALQRQLAFMRPPEG